MKHIRISARPDLDEAPPFVEYLLDSPHVSEARAVDWNRADAATTTHLYAVDGDVTRFADRAKGTDGVESVTVSAVDETPSYGLLELRETAVPMFGVVEEAIARAGLVVRRPLVYRDRRIEGHVVGDASALQGVLDGAPDAMGVRVEEIGDFPSVRANPTSQLSDRQWEALETALELGYYDKPRGATHEQIADHLGCAPNTASEHLQKAEAKLVRAVVESIGLTV